MIEKVKCECGHDLEDHNFYAECSNCDCKRVKRRPMTAIEDARRGAFIDGAAYMFTRFGRWYGQGHMFYLSHFKTCKEHNLRPNLTSMIGEEIDGLATEYGYGWRENRNEWTFFPEPPKGLDK